MLSASVEGSQALAPETLDLATPSLAGPSPGWTILTSSSPPTARRWGISSPARPHPFLSRELHKDHICAPRPEPGSDARPHGWGHHRCLLGRGWNFRAVTQKALKKCGWLSYFQFTVERRWFSKFLLSQHKRLEVRSEGEADIVWKLTHAYRDPGHDPG